MSGAAAAPPSVRNGEAKLDDAAWQAEAKTALLQSPSIRNPLAKGPARPQNSLLQPVGEKTYGGDDADLHRLDEELAAAQRRFEEMPLERDVERPRVAPGKLRSASSSSANTRSRRRLLRKQDRDVVSFFDEQHTHSIAAVVQGFGECVRAMAVSDGDDAGARCASVALEEGEFSHVVVCDLHGLGNVCKLVFPNLARDGSSTPHVAFVARGDEDPSDRDLLVVVDHNAREHRARVHAWDLALPHDGSPVRYGRVRLEGEDAMRVDHVALSQRGHALAFSYILSDGSSHGGINVWDLREAIRFLRSPSEPGPSASSSAAELGTLGGPAEVRARAKLVAAPLLPSGQLFGGASGDVPAHALETVALALSADGRWLASSYRCRRGGSPLVHVWHTLPMGDASAANAPHTVEVLEADFAISGYVNPASVLAFSADAQFLATAHNAEDGADDAIERGEDHLVLLWRLPQQPPDNKVLRHPHRALSGHTGRVTHVLFSPGANAEPTKRSSENTRSRASKASVSSHVAPTTGHRHRREPPSLRYSPALPEDAKSEPKSSCASVMRGGSAESSGGEGVRRPAAEPNHAESGKTQSTGVSERILTASDDATLLLYDTTPSGDATTTALRAFRFHSAPISAMVFSPGGGHFASADKEGAVRVWRARRDQRDDDKEDEYLILKSDEDVDHSAFVAPVSADRFATVSGEHLRIWQRPPGDIRTEAKWPQLVAETFIPAGQQRLAASLVTSRDGRFAAIAFGTGSVSVWDLDHASDGRLHKKGTFQAGAADEGVPEVCVAFAPDGSVVATGGGTGLVRLWDAAESFAELGAGLWGREDRVSSIIFLEDASMLVAANSSGELHVWDRSEEQEPGLPLQTLQEHGKGETLLAFSAGAMTLASTVASDDPIITLWAVARGHTAPLSRRGRLQGHVRAVSAMAFSPDGFHLATAGDRHLRLWGTIEDAESSTGALRVFLTAKPGEAAPVSSVVFLRSDLLWAQHSGAVRGLHMSRPRSSLGEDQPSLELAKAKWFEPALHRSEDAAADAWRHLRPFLARHPSLLRQTAPMQRSLFQAVASAGRTGLLEAWMSEEGGLDRQELVAAVLADAPNSGSKTIRNGALWCALVKQNRLTVRLLLRILEQALGSAHLWDQPRMVQLSVHPTDGLRHETLSAALRMFPEITLGFLQRIDLVQAYPFVCGVDARFPWYNQEPQVHGSKERSPEGFWEKLIQEREAKARGRSTFRGLIAALSQKPTRAGSMKGTTNERFDAPLDGAMQSKSAPALRAEDPFGVAGELDLAEGLYEVDDQTRHKGLPAAAFLLPLKGIASLESNVLEDIVEACDTSGDYAAMEAPVVEALVNFKWRVNARPWFYRDLFFSVVMVVAFTLAVLGIPPATVKEDTLYEILGFVAFGVEAALLFMFTGKEVQAIREVAKEDSSIVRRPWPFSTAVWRHYASDYWNGVDAIYISEMFLTNFVLLIDFFSAISSEENRKSKTFRPTTIIGGLSMPMIYWSLVRYLLIHEEYGFIVRTIVEITQGIIGFIIIIIVVIIGYAASFKLLFSWGPGRFDLGELTNGEVLSDEVFGQDTFIMSAVSTFSFMLGDFDRQEFAASASEGTTTFIWLIYQVFVTIVMLNLLIAIMGGIFETVSEGRRAHFLYSKAKIVLEYDRLARSSCKEAATKDAACLEVQKRFPPWLQVLRPKSLESREATTVADLQASLATFQQHLEDHVEAVVSERTDWLLGRIRELQATPKPHVESRTGISPRKAEA